jgi:hypothetical protein
MCSYKRAFYNPIPKVSNVLDFDNLVVEFGKDVKKNLEGNEGEPEAQLTTPVSHFLKGFGDLHNLSVTLVRETSITVAGGVTKNLVPSAQTLASRSMGCLLVMLS